MINIIQTKIGTFTFTSNCTGSVVSYQIGRVAILNISAWSYTSDATLETTLTMGITSLKPGMPVTFSIIRAGKGLVALGSIDMNGSVTVRMLGNQGYNANEDLCGQAIYFI